MKTSISRTRPLTALALWLVVGTWNQRWQLPDQMRESKKDLETTEGLFWKRCLMDALRDDILVLVESVKENRIARVEPRQALGVEGAKALATALERNISVTEVDLQGNDIGVEGAHALAAALGRNTSLTTLELSHNIIGVECAGHRVGEEQECHYAGSSL